MFNKNAQLNVDTSSIPAIEALLKRLKDDAHQQSGTADYQEVTKAHIEVEAIAQELDSLNKRMAIAAKVLGITIPATKVATVATVVQLNSKKATRVKAPRPSACDPLTTDVRAMDVGDARALTPEEHKQVIKLRCRMKRSEIDNFKDREFDIVKNLGNTARPTKIVRIA